MANFLVWYACLIFYNPDRQRKTVSDDVVEQSSSDGLVLISKGKRRNFNNN